MLPHLPYFEVLASADEGLPVWAPTIAGLAVLSFVDSARADASVVDADWTGMKAASDAVAALREGSPLRRPMLAILERLRDGGSDWTGINRALFNYGRALDIEGHWSLAADVFATVADIARDHRDAAMAIEATTALGGAARRSGDWDRSAHSYAAAAHLADAIGDRASGLTVQVGTANTHIARGNLPAARMILDDVIAAAGKWGLDGVEAIALHGRASVAHLQGQFADTIDYAYKALEKTTNATARDSIMADLAAAFAEIGLRTAARDAHMVIALTSAQQWVRWQATINLMELAALDGEEPAFDSYANELRYAALDPRLRSYFLLYFGQGALAFGRIEEGRTALADAQEFSLRHKINQVAHEASAALASIDSGAVRRPSAPAQTSFTHNVEAVAAAITRLRESATTAPAASAWEGSY
jgi:hypothetical protein